MSADIKIQKVKIEKEINLINRKVIRYESFFKEIGKYLTEKQREKIIKVLQEIK